MIVAPSAVAALIPGASARLGDLTARADERRRLALPRLAQETKSRLGQFMTPAPIAEFMAAMFDTVVTPDVLLLDPGAGVGSLTAAWVQRIGAAPHRPERVTVTAYEIDPVLAELLRQTMLDCEQALTAVGVRFSGEVIERDFVDHASSLLRSPLLSGPGSFTHVITNPPYKKIPSASAHRHQLRLAGIEATNLYAAFVGLAVRLLVPHGELVAITPRSFCNGPYFRPFRELLLAEAGIDRVHSFEARDVAFRDDEVLQENIIYHAVKGGRPDRIYLSLSQGLDLEHSRARTVGAAEVLHPGDPELVLHLPARDTDAGDRAQVLALANLLRDLGLGVSTGPVVDFRLRAHIRSTPEPGTVPLIYPAHFNGGRVKWPRDDIRKPNAIERNEHSQRWLMPNGCYVLTRRFTSKEERRRLVAVVFEGTEAPADWIGFENHVNVLHHYGAGMPLDLAWGLATYLNSSVVDRYFRSFNGHTQVNAGDLRALRYPARTILCDLGRRALVGGVVDQDSIDQLVGDTVFSLAGAIADNVPVTA